MAIFFGTASSETIYGSGGSDTIYGFAGRDTLYGNSGNDSLIGGESQDSLYGGSGDDTLNSIDDEMWGESLFGGMGNDVYQVDSSNDRAVEGFNEGIDTVRSRVNYFLDDNLENLVLTSDIWGEGNNLNNGITGNSLNNYLYGNAGNDTIAGGAGNDTIAGGAGNDSITGGAGNDHFPFYTALSVAGIDKITDFVVGSDKIILYTQPFGHLETFATSSGNPLEATDFTAINVAAVSEVVTAGNQYYEIVYNIQTGNLFYNPNNHTAGFGEGGGQFATIGNLPGLSNTDFLVSGVPAG